MRKLMSMFLCLGLSVAAQARPDNLNGPFQDSLTRFETSLAKGVPTLRDLTNGALVNLALPGRPVEKSVEWIRRALSLQEMNPASGSYGEVPWQQGHPEIRDANAIEFTMQAMGLLFITHADRLPPAFQEECKPHLVAAVAAIRRHQVPTSYTNIFLMKSVNLSLLGRILKDPSVEAEGEGMLEHWLQFTAQHGISEYDSPTYYDADLDSLVSGWLCGSETLHTKCGQAMELFWKDIGANFFPARGSLSGPHSRDYDFLTGRGSIGRFMAQAGWVPVSETMKPDMEAVYLLENQLSPRGYRPSASARQLAEQPEKVVLSTFYRGEPEKERGRERYNYVTPQFAMGSTSADYGPQGKPVSIELAGPADMPSISVIVDQKSNPYGRVHQRDASGHNKPHRDNAHLVCVQEKGSMLVLLSLQPTRDHIISDQYSTSILLPARVDSFTLADTQRRPPRGGTLNGSRLEVAKPARIPIGLRQPLLLRQGATSVRIEVLAAEVLGGGPASIELVAEPDGLRFGAVRLTIEHYRGPRQSIPGRAKVALLFQAGPHVGTADCHFRESGSGDSWTGSVDVDGTHLEARANRGRPEARLVNGREMRFATLEVER